MSKRHSDALAAWGGACNPSAIAHGIVNACAEMRAAPGFSGTQALCDDSAIRVLVYQLAYLTGVTTGAEELARGKSIAACVAECESRVAAKAEA